MRVIDARSGKEMKIGDTVTYPDGERNTLLDIDEGLFSVNAVVEHVYRHFETGELVTDRRQIPLAVRFFHPSFFLQKVALIPS